GFNGAAPDRARKRAATSIPILASRMLQWGRARSGAETGAGAGRVARRACALQWGRARSGAETLRTSPISPGTSQASMGPRPIGRGNARDFINSTKVERELQWGRARSGAETSSCTQCWPSGWHGFNGAAPDRARKLMTGLQTVRSAKCGFNGAAPDRARKPTVTGSTGHVYVGFNGAAPDRARKLQPA